MKLSDLIVHAQTIKHEFGDLPVTLDIVSQGVSFDEFHFAIIQNQEGRVLRVDIMEGEAEDSGDME